MKAIVHIGQSKAGSTSLQSFLLKNRKRLEAGRLHYLRDRLGAGPDIELLVQGMLAAETDLSTNQNRRKITPLRPENAARAVSNWLSRLTECRDQNPDGVFVASCEQLFLWLESPEQIRGLHDVLSGLFDDVTYVCYLRRQEDWIASRYTQSLRAGHILTLEEYTDKQLRQFSAEQRVNLWADTVGKDRMKIRLLESDSLVGGDLITDFLALAGVDNTGFEPPERANESFTPQNAEFARQINLACRSRKGGRNRTEDLRRSIMRSLTDLSTGQDKLRLPQTLVARVRSHYAEENARLAAAWFSDRSELFPARPARDETSEAGSGTETLAATALELMLAGGHQHQPDAGEKPGRKPANRNKAQKARKSKRQAAK